MRRSAVKMTTTSGECNSSKEKRERQYFPNADNGKHVHRFIWTACALVERREGQETVCVHCMSLIPRMTTLRLYDELADILHAKRVLLNSMQPQAELFVRRTFEAYLHQPAVP